MGYRKQNPISVNGVFIADANKVTSSTSAVNQAVLTTSAVGVPVLTALASDGQLIIGSTAGAPAAATLTAGTGISITNASNSITVAVSGAGVGQTITGNTGGALSPTAGNWNILGSAASGATVRFAGSGSTLTLNTTDSLANTLIGSAAGNGTLSGTFNTGLGETVLSALTSGSVNTAIGYSSLNAITTPTGNTAIGASSLNALITGQFNIGIGDGAGSNYTGSESSNIVIGNSGVTAESHSIHIGTQGSGNGQQNQCFIAGIVGVTPSNQQVVVIDSTTGQLGVSSGDVVTWNVVTTNQTGTTNNGYICVSAGGALTISLPTTSAVGDQFSVMLDGATSWQITQAAGQSIRLSSLATTVGAGGSLTSTAQGDTVTLICRVANTTWTALSSIGNITVV